ncbi:E3 SUMO-protein ligase ZNF451 [Synchiropus splendidus]|uniref:E3 SUMO-protein ligase ZNF451 n=1 Tax=Synchiropus splendidus TaxID=270530 RepID=UPI00237E91D0|nr:E3 SUMO-protein ligase ZNF451 [Synchiropus splendidus]XP_053730821.1 E3 SUMO-protein ligase ZNF451 [Synchiropus splendidus]XP_053730822.1 E3 SUMO-protein ligase ZNF451 [Synchiropus splendidus]XP_053730823.1 E3 SUMO-protein ligase ZNF451 [Synchiropus splendidus]
MSSPTTAAGDEEAEEVDDVEFVSEGPLRPVLDSIDLLSDSEEEKCSSWVETTAEKVQRQRDEANAALAKLALRVEREKRERAEKLKAFKEKQNIQMTRAKEFLSSVTSESQLEARRCVQMWANMPDPTQRRRHRAPSFSPNTSTRYTCPVSNCGRIFDNPLLLGGHLKRFDHSPCDPTIHLKGSPSEIFACVACGQHFPTKESWSAHRESKLALSNTECHSVTQTFQLIVCFACPACFLLFSLRDECLQHMSTKNHFTESLPLTASSSSPQPVPIPQYVKESLIALCQETSFSVRCGRCQAVLKSHQSAMAHFNVKCRNSSLIATADKTIVEVMRRLQIRGQCLLCCQLFLSQADIEEHKESTQHDVEINQTMARALLQHGRFGETQLGTRSNEVLEKSLSIDHWIPKGKRMRKRKTSGETPAKRRRQSPSLVIGWVCECGQQFSEEAKALKHLMAANQIFHQCGLCGKQMGEASITRLHMCRFHGFANFSNFFFYCCKCSTVMPEVEDVHSHVSENHKGHTFFSEQEVSEAALAMMPAKPSTSYDCAAKPSTAGSSKPTRTWMCRMCEDIFDSEAAVQKHCSGVNNHSFQRFICGHCSQKFFKETTLHRHCVREHDGRIKGGFFCGLCDSMQFESISEFLEHYKSLHSKDYYCLDEAEVVPPTVPQICPCLGSEKSSEELKPIKTRCMKELASEGKCQYVCEPCSVTLCTYGKIKTHVAMKHPSLNLDMSFEVVCTICPETFKDVPSFHTHYHDLHCTLEPCRSSRTIGTKVKTESTTVGELDAEEMKTDTSVKDEMEDPNTIQATAKDAASSDESDEDVKRALAFSLEEDSPDLQEALQRSMLDF